MKPENADGHKQPATHARDAFQETPASMKSTLATTFDQVAGLVSLLRSEGCSRLVVTGEGCSHTAAMMCEMAFSRWGSMPVQVSLTSELPFLASPIDRDTCLVVLTRTGERRFILDAVRDIRGSCGRVVAITGNPDGAIGELADDTVLTREGLEPAFLKSKSTLCGVTVLLSLAASSGASGSELQDRHLALSLLPDMVGEAFAAVDGLKVIAGEKAAEVEHWAIAAAGPSYGSAADGALKLHEITTVHASPYHLSDIYHGALGQLSDSWGAVVLVTAETRRWARVVGEQLVARGVDPVLWLDATPDGAAPPGAQYERISLTALRDRDLPGEAVELLSPPMFLPALYTLVLENALARGIDPDAPPNMAYMLDLILPDGGEEPDLVAPR